MILHFGQAACTLSTSSEISTDQPLASGGVLLCSSFVKQPFASVHCGSPYCVLKAARSDSMFGSSNASTIATVVPEPPEPGSKPYALASSEGVRPPAGPNTGAAGRAASLLTPGLPA